MNRPGFRGISIDRRFWKPRALQVPSRAASSSSVKTGTSLQNQRDELLGKVQARWSITIQFNYALES
jgi:hypothetical protein